MTKKKLARPVSRKPRDDTCKVTGRLPEWMREYLADKGIEAQFSPSSLTKEQRLAIEHAERLLQQEMNGLIRVTYDPQSDLEPQAELTDYAKSEYRQRLAEPAETDEEDADLATHETSTDKAEDIIVREIKDALEEHSDPEEKRGIPSPIVMKLSSEFFKKVKKKPKHEILQLCNDLLESGFSGGSAIAFDWAFRLKKLYEESDFQLLETWLMKHVHRWGTCDDLCTHALGAFVYQFPEFTKRAREWTRSENRWVRRASAVCLIHSVRRKDRLNDVFETADALLADPDLMVQKGYGWMLKEASNHYPLEVFDYVMKNRRKMPRTALRYAIEKLSPEHKAEAMKRE